MQYMAEDPTFDQCDVEDKALELIASGKVPDCILYDQTGKTYTAGDTKDTDTTIGRYTNILKTNVIGLAKGSGARDIPYEGYNSVTKKIDKAAVTKALPAWVASMSKWSASKLEASAHTTDEYCELLKKNANTEGCSYSFVK